MIKLFMYSLAFLMLLPLSAQVERESLSLEVEVVELKNNKGKVNLAVYDSDKYFPNHPGNAILTKKSYIENGRVTFKLQLTPGIYAISVIHDENENEKLDTNWLGMPKEGAATSNNVKGFMGPPDFEDAKFEIREEAIWQTIRMNYF